jgi:hypothetical protein
MKSKLFLLTLALCIMGAFRGPADSTFYNSASYRWLNKEVLGSRVLDNMESLDNWIAFTTGAPEVVDARVVSKTTESNSVVTQIALTRENSRDGGQSLRVRIPAGLDVPGPKSGRGWGTAGVRRQFNGEDWSDFNRISLWIRPECPGFQVVHLELRLYNEGTVKLPALYAQEGENSLILRNHEWNHVVWEIGNVARDKVSKLEVAYLMSGHEPEANDTVMYDFDRLELQKVEPDYIEGWNVWPGRISFSHSGYQTGSSKSAIASGLDAKEFRVINQETGEVAFSGPLQNIANSLGNFQVMDFSGIRQPGTYLIEAGKTRTNSFCIDGNVWRQTILKAIHFFYSERCGMAIPGIHGICHRDWTVIHGDKKIVINGGWHDAGDLTQGLGNTGEIVYGMFSLAERLHARTEDPELYDKLVNEAQWGLDWILKTRFGDGYRNEGSISSRWTNGIIGDFDDITSTARNSPMANFTASAAEAIAYRVLKESDPRLACYSLKTAEADWQFAVDAMAHQDNEGPKGLWHGTFDSDNVEYDVASVGVLASVDLWRATGDKRYEDKAIEMARIILDSQERNKPDWDIPLLGFFYTGPSKDRIVHYCHRGRAQAPILALTQLCDAFPDNPNWMKWYSSVALYSQYLKTIARYTEPYGVMPASVYKDDEYLTVPESRRESFRVQVLKGVPLGKGYYLRLFPVWMDYRGHFGTILPQAQALASAAHLRGDLQGTQLSQHQLEWIIGRNPFSQSAMWGEGYDYPPLYAPFPGDITGALPVGIQTRGDSDVPYWPVQNTWTYKEIWSHPDGRWIWLMRDLAGPALVEGYAISAVEFTETSTGRKMMIPADPVTGHFRSMLPEGIYRIRCQGEEMERTFLPAGIYNLDLRPGKNLDYEITGTTSASGEVIIRVNARGAGIQRFQIRTDNLLIAQPGKEITLKPGIAGTFEWRGHIQSKLTPWTGVVVPNSDLSSRKEIMGSVWETFSKNK